LGHAPQRLQSLYEGAHRERLRHARKAEERADAVLRGGGAPESAQGAAAFSIATRNTLLPRSVLGELSESERDVIATAFGSVAQAYRNMHLYEDSARNARQSVKIARSLPLGQRLGVSLSLLAIALRGQGDIEGALQSIREARRVAEKAVYASETERMPAMYAILSRQGAILAGEDSINLERPAEAVEPLRKALDLTEEAARKSPNDYTSRSRLGTAARKLGNVLYRQEPKGGTRSL